MPPPARAAGRWTADPGDRVRLDGAPVTVGRVLGLPHGVDACLFDLDGVLTETATLHAAAWKAMFDRYLREAARRRSEPFVPFDEGADYDDYVDGRPRIEGVRAFLAARGITLPTGSPSDPPWTETLHGLGAAKNALVVRMIDERGVTPFPGSVRYVAAARDHGLRRAVVSSSANCRHVLAAAGIDDLFETVVDGLVAAREHLAGKPAPDTYLAAADRLAVEPAHAAVFEDALAGIEAAVAGRFGFVVAVDRVGQAEALASRGADTVVQDLADLIEP